MSTAQIQLKVLADKTNFKLSLVNGDRFCLPSVLVLPCGGLSQTPETSLTYEEESLYTI